MSLAVETAVESLCLVGLGLESREIVAPVQGRSGQDSHADGPKSRRCELGVDALLLVDLRARVVQRLEVVLQL